jgi:hypothetical protein
MRGGIAQPTGKRPSYVELEALVASQAALIAELRGKVAGLEARLNASSGNSSRPPSSDGLSKPPADPKRRSLRRRSGRTQGGQEGHEGARLEPVAVPDEQVEHPPERWECCDGDLAGAEPLVSGESRQVFDLPEGVLLRVVEHVAGRRRCGCGHVTAGEFPAGVGAPTQYGPGVRALGVYLCAYQHLPYDRAALALRDIVGAAVSPGSLTDWVAQAAGGRRPVRLRRASARAAGSGAGRALRRDRRADRRAPGLGAQRLDRQAHALHRPRPARQPGDRRRRRAARV